MTDAIRSLNRLAKWRMVLAGWQLGTRSEDDPECAAVLDAREALLVLRAEVTALTRALIEEGVVSQEHMQDLVGDEADRLSAALAQRFPGMRATEEGVAMDTQVAAETMRRMHFKP